MHWIWTGLFTKAEFNLQAEEVATSFGYHHLGST